MSIIQSRGAYERIMSRDQSSPYGPLFQIKSRNENRTVHSTNLYQKRK